MPRVHFNSEIMQSGACPVYLFRKIVGSKPAFILNNSHALCTADGVLYPDSERRDRSVVFFFSIGKFPSPGFLYGLHYLNTLRLITLIAGILIQHAGIGKRIHRIGCFFIVYLSGNTLADKKNHTGRENNHCVFKRMFLLAAVIFLLFFHIHRAGNLPFRAIVQKNRQLILTKFLKYPGELFLCLGRHYTGMAKTFLKNMIQTVYERIAMFLPHIKTGCMVFLKRIILQINQYEEQPVCNGGKRAVFINGKTAKIFTQTSTHLIAAKIIIMRIFKIEKQLVKLFHRKSGQSPETFGIISIISIFHFAKIRA